MYSKWIDDFLDSHTGLLAAKKKKKEYVENWIPLFSQKAEFIIRRHRVGISWLELISRMGFFLAVHVYCVHISRHVECVLKDSVALLEVYVPLIFSI